jgi:hypothetical protein
MPYTCPELSWHRPSCDEVRQRYVGQIPFGWHSLSRGMWCLKIPFGWHSLPTLSPIHTLQAYFWSVLCVVSQSLNFWSTSSFHCKQGLFSSATSLDPFLQACTTFLVAPVIMSFQFNLSTLTKWFQTGTKFHLSLRLLLWTDVHRRRQDHWCCPVLGTSAIYCSTLHLINGHSGGVTHA